MIPFKAMCRPERCKLMSFKRVLEDLEEVNLITTYPVCTPISLNKILAFMFLPPWYGTKCPIKTRIKEAFLKWEVALVVQAKVAVTWLICLTT